MRGGLGRDRPAYSGWGSIGDRPPRCRTLLAVPDDDPFPVAGRPNIGWVVLTMADRPVELARAVASLGEGDAAPDVVLVVNGATVAPADRPPGARIVELPENVGIPAGRNTGAAQLSTELIGFLDDDAEVLSTGLASQVADRFARDETLGVVSLRIVDPDTGETSRRHVPRLRVGDPGVSSEVTHFLGGACVIRRAAFEQVGGYPDDFFYAMEESDLSLRLVDAGWRLFYDADLVVAHPATEPARHANALSHTARNRVLMARRCLPAPVGLAHVVSWGIVAALRGRSLAAVRAWWQGTSAGRAMPVERRPIRWRTVWRLTRLGRPPIF